MLWGDKMYGLPYENPLTQYHDYLRLGAPAGYPNQGFASPHPYEMSSWSQMRQPNRYPFRYNTGRALQMQIYAPTNRGVIQNVDRSLYRPYRNHSWSYRPANDQNRYALGLTRR